MSKEIYDELVAAGAPELPDGYFYRIDRDSDRRRWGDPDRIWVDIRKRKRFGSYSDGFYGSLSSDGKCFSIDSARKAGYAPQERLAEALESLYAEWRATTYDSDIRSEYDKFLGDHP